MWIVCCSIDLLCGDVVMIGSCVDCLLCKKMFSRVA